MQRLVEDVLHLGDAELKDRSLTAEEAAQLIGLINGADDEGLKYLLDVINELAKTGR